MENREIKEIETKTIFKGTGNYHIIQRQQNSRGGKRNGPKNAG